MLELLLPFPYIQKICVDNEGVRKTVLENKKLDIKIVPTLLVIDSSIGSAEKYEGINAFTFVQELIDTITLRKKESGENEEDRYDENGDENGDENDDENDDEEKESDNAGESEEERVIIKKPPVLIRSGAGKYKITEFVDQPQEPPIAPVKPVANSLMSVAMAMQKERETIDPANSRK